jgi:uncharacterized protein (DUF1697 family)
MPRFVALLRGINVGKANRVPMAQLRTLLDGCGYTKVETLLNSGNAVFQARSGRAASHARIIGAALADQLGLEVPVIVKSVAEFAAIIAANPFTLEASEQARLLVAFTQDVAALSALTRIGPLVVAPEQFALGTQAAYLYCARGILESAAAAALLGRIGRSATSRNWATVQKLQALV